MGDNHDNTTSVYNFEDTIEEWNVSFQSMYDYSDMMRFKFDTRPSIQQLLLGLFLTLKVILLLNYILLLLTALSPKCRSISPSWYLYHLCVIKILETILVIPLELAGMQGTNCYATTALNALFDMLQSLTILFFNIETVFTVISPRSCLKRRPKKRFIIVNIILWVGGVVFVLTGTMLSVHTYPRYFCFYMLITFEIIRISVCHWLVALLTVIFSVIAIVHYRKARSTGITYNQFTDGSGTAVNPKEWFICLLIVDCLFAFGHILLNHMTAVIAVHRNVFVYELCRTGFVSSLIFAMYSLSNVRTSVRIGFAWLLGLLRKRNHYQCRARMNPSEQVILEADPMDDDAL